MNYGGYKINITTLKGELKQGYPLLDAKLIFNEFEENQIYNYSGKLLMTYDNDGSYSNEVALYRIDIDYETFAFNATILKEINACSLEVDTFYVNKITVIPKS